MSNETITREPCDQDAWICICGNTPCSDGFYPCDRDGTDMEPTIGSHWNGLYRCDRCERVIDMNTLEVVGRRRVHHVVCSAYSDLMTNLADYDALELNGVCTVDKDDDGTTYYEPCSEDRAEFWSVYAHCVAGGVECIGDFETPALAEAYAQALSAKLNLPVR